MTEQNTSLNPLRSKQHFEILDGLRGVAAVSVVIFHFMEIAVPDYTKSFIAHAYLAVDFFFCLSGFVIAYAYDQRLGKIGVANFFKLRLIRLHPLVIIGSIIGLLAFVFDPYSNLFQVYSGKTFLLFVTSCVMVPYAIVRERFFNNFHLNPPMWSLFWEYIANIVYALVLVKLRNKVLMALTAIAAIVLCYESYKSGNLAVGWSGDNFAGGGIRVAFSFLVGMLVYRSNWIIKSKLGFAVISLCLFITFIIPYADKTNYFADPLIVILAFPLLVALGAGATLKPVLKSTCTFFGDLSYPLYMVHYPFIWLYMSWVESAKPQLDQMIIVMAVGVPLLIALAYAIWKLIDIPIRGYLKRKMEKGVVKAA